MHDAQRDWHGISVELWQALAAELGLTYELREYALADLLAATARGEVAVAVAALTVTAQREESVDFTHAYFRSSLGVATRTDSEGSGLAALAPLASAAFLQAVGVLIVVLFVVGALVWLVERRHNPEEFGGSAAQGLGSGFWWSAVTMTTVGYGDKAPRTLLGRALGLVWMFTSIIIIAGMTGAIASAFTVQSLQSGIDNLGDVVAARSATVRSSTSEEFLRAAGAQPVGFDTIDEALAALARGDVSVVVHDSPVLKYQITAEHAGELTLLPLTFRAEAYAFALAEDHGLTEALNRALLDYLNTPEWAELQRRYLGD